MPEGPWSISAFRARTLEELCECVPSKPTIHADELSRFRIQGVADPFAIRRGDGWYLFYEALMQGTSIATIACSFSQDLTAWNHLGVVLRAEHHLSYPFVFEYDGHVYMMPESKSVRRVDLYRATEFPFQWKFEKTLLRGPLMDASMVRYGGRFWIFVGWRSYWLKIFYADSPLGNWRSHLLPVARRYDKSSTRPGGRPIVLDNSLIRFSQDNTKYYGHQLRAWKITTLNRLWFRQQPLIDRPILQPSGSGWNANQMHHADVHLQDNGELLVFVDGA